MEALQKLPVRRVIVAWIWEVGDGMMKAEWRVMLIPVNEGSSQAPLAKPYW